MTEIRFYHMVQKRLEQALPEIVAKALEKKHRVVVMAGSEARVASLDSLLWTYHPASFLPHSATRDGFEAEQPVWLTMADENPNGADVLILTDGAKSEKLADFGLCCELFDGNDDAMVTEARNRWAAYKEKGYDLAYFQQDDQGRWQKKQ